MSDHSLWSHAGLPSELEGLLSRAPAETAAACARDWTSLLSLHSSLLLPLTPTSSEETPHYLAHLFASLDAEEARWREAARSLQRQWASDRAALVAWWRAEDETALQRRFAQASEFAGRLASSVSSLPPSRLSVERVALGRITGLRALHSSILLSLCERELSPADDVSNVQRVENLLRAASCWDSPVARSMLPTLERCVGQMLPSVEEQQADTSGERSEEGESDFTSLKAILNMPRRVRAALACLLLSLTPDVQPMQRITALLPLVFPLAVDEEPLSFRSQVELFKSFYVTAAAASAALSELSVDHSWLPDETKEIQRMDAEVVEIALNSALQRRPHTWGVRPPNAREFFMWCAISDETISGTVAMTKDDLDETQGKLPSS